MSAAAAAGPEAEGGSEALARIRRQLATSGGTTAQDVSGAVRAVPGLRSDAERWHLARSARYEVAGAGVLQPLLEDPQVTDVLVNGPDQVWLDRGHGLQRVEVPGLGNVRELATRLPGRAGQPGSGWTMRLRSPRAGCPTAPACMRSWHHCALRRR